MRIDTYLPSGLHILSHKLFINKTNGGIFPADRVNAELFDEISNGEYQIELTRPRNIKFHRKYFALLNYLFDLFSPAIDVDANYKFGTPEKNFDTFRRDMAIVCGYHDAVINLKGEYRIIAKSISFASMDDIEFERLYSRTIDYALSSDMFVCNDYGVVNDTVERLLSYA